MRGAVAASHQLRRVRPEKPAMLSIRHEARRYSGLPLYASGSG